MANKKSNPREARMKLRIGELSLEVEQLKREVKSTLADNLALRDGRKSLIEERNTLHDKLFEQQQLLSQNELELSRKDKLINILIDKM